MIFSPYDNASYGDESIGFLVFAISLFPIILPSATIQPFNVGYSTVELANQNTLVGINYLGIGGGEMTLNEAVPYVEGMIKGNGLTSADQIQVQNATGGYNIYYMSNGKNAKGAAISGLEGKWAKGGTFVPTTDTVSAGNVFWYIRNGWTAESAPLKITIAGEVNTLASADANVDLAFKLITNPYPADLPLNDGIPYVEGMTSGNGLTTADQIQIQTASGGYDIYYMSNGKNAKGATISGLEGKWAKGGTFTPATDAVIPANKGAWYLRKGTTDFTITVARPFDL